jgi:hypothetical protein
MYVRARGAGSEMRIAARAGTEGEQQENEERAEGGESEPAHGIHFCGG